MSNFTRKYLDPIADAIGARDHAATVAAVQRLIDLNRGPAWNQYAAAFLSFLTDGAARFSIFATGGNSKLPFLAFSALPGGRHCPGAGACWYNAKGQAGRGFCYSRRAWRYPAAFFRQCQNSVLMQSAAGRGVIFADLDRILSGRKYMAASAEGQLIDFRLYVDGDFADLDQLTAWFQYLETETGSRLAAYGYSKSFEIFRAHAAAGGRFPENYVMNISSGHKYGPDLIAEIEALSVTRGHFVAHDIGHKVTTADHGKPEHRAALVASYRAATGRKAFACPGQCGSCTARGHACGSAKLAGLDIVIAVH